MYQELQSKVTEEKPSYSREEIWKELHKRSPETHPDDNPSILNIVRLFQNYLKMVMFNSKIKVIKGDVNHYE